MTSAHSTVSLPPLSRLGINVTVHVELAAAAEVSGPEEGLRSSMPTYRGLDGYKLKLALLFEAANVPYLVCDAELQLDEMWRPPAGQSGNQTAMSGGTPVLEHSIKKL
jgi:hypothetical protein